MPLRTILRYLANNERLVQRIAESYPVRRAAQLAISVFFKGKEKISDINSPNVGNLVSFLRKFGQNVREGIDDAKRQLKK